MPSYAGYGTDGPELVDDFPRNEVDIVIPEPKSGEPDALSGQLV